MKIRLLISSFAFASVLFAGCAGSGSGSDARIQTRKEVLELTPQEVDRFVSALKAMKATPSAYDPATNAYDYFVKIHLQAFSEMGMMHGVHMGPHFLTWHREMLRRFESEMRRAAGDSGLTLPYWDWTNEASTARLFQNDFLGGNGDPSDNYIVKTGPFREGQWALKFTDATDGEFGDTPDPVATSALSRAFGMNGISTLPVRGQARKAMGIPSYDVAPFSPNSNINESFRNYVEGWWPGGSRMHNQVHVWVGGAMGTGASPNDPAFFLHHANVDRLWASWQAVNGNGSMPADLLDDELWLFDGVVASETINLSAMKIRYSELVRQ